MLGLRSAAALIAGAGHTLRVWVINRFGLLSVRLLRALARQRSPRTAAATDGLNSPLALACPVKIVPDAHTCAGLDE